LSQANKARQFIGSGQDIRIAGYFVPESRVNDCFWPKADGPGIQLLLISLFVAQDDWSSTIVMKTTSTKPKPPICNSTKENNE
jgi:hypothetical protein